MGLLTTSNLYMPTTSQYQQGKAGEMSRLINAALVDSRFCSMLLNQPEQALEQGYNGELFQLSSTDKRFILTAKAASLTDLASRWLQFNNRYSN